ncbi:MULTISPECIES: LacI family DNA-binding transcriptional regulator [unclassified Caulobacter]|uniref:LacI family DNA-binding transcriptional regulator n=1 Tax=unclassified Caulobacter TaxID=2648921 RepID=UPI000783226B|nr:MULTISPECIES: LacI family DNA-binding transcriptional regulator [unclassified Caulobacter]AZS21863.1 LacI family transcriptional regulator [Caulobacter sp. FWC26]
MSRDHPAPPAGRIKMADIARLAGVSTSTVSRALSGHKSIPQGLRDRIAELAQAHGYVVNQSARSLRLQRTHVIGVVVPLGHEREQLISDPFFLEMIGRLADEITGRGYEVLLKKVVAPRTGWLQRIVQSQRSDGLLVIGQSDQHDALNTLADEYRPLVVWGGDIAERRYCTVGTDNVAGARMAVQHLVAQGRRRIAFLGPPGAPEVELRRAGYLQALSEAGLTPEPDLFAPAHFTIETAQPTVQALVDSGASFDAVFAASDLIAMTAVQTLKQAGRSVPEEVSVVGFDDIALAQHGAPPLTTVRQDLAAGARGMVDLLFRRIAGGAPESVFMAPELIVRQT